MFKNIYVRLGMLILAAFMIMLFFIWWSGKDIVGAGGFKRNFLSVNPRVIAEASIASTAYQIAGLDGKYLYTSDTDPRIVHRYSWSLASADTQLLTVPSGREVILSYKIMADSVGGRLYLGNYGAVFSSPYNTKDTNEVSKMRFETPLFTRVADMSTSSLLVRGFDSTRKEQLIYKINKSTGKIENKVDIFGATRDGGFSTDGMLGFDETTQQVVYIQYYKNTFFCLDTNLNMRYVGKTIDTTATTVIETKQVNGGQRSGIMSKTPLRQLFRIAKVDNGCLFVVSNLKSDNDRAKDFHDNLVIDVYDLTSGRNLGSFYLAQSEEYGRLKDLLFTNDKLVGLYERKIIVYQTTDNFSGL